MNGYTEFATGIDIDGHWFAQCNNNGIILRQFGLKKSEAIEALYNIISILSTNRIIRND